MTRSPAVGALAALAVVTAVLEAAAVALDPRDLAGTLVIAAGIWFQGAWALLVWARPRRELLVTGILANLLLLAVCGVRLAGLGARQPAASELLVLVFQGVLIVGLVGTLLAGPRAARGVRRLPALVGATTALLAAASVTMAGPTLAPPGELSPIIGTATRSEAPARTLPPAGGNPYKVPLAADPTSGAGLAIAVPPGGPTQSPAPTAAALRSATDAASSSVEPSGASAEPAVPPSDSASP